MEYNRGNSLLMQKHRTLLILFATLVALVLAGWVLPSLLSARQQGDPEQLTNPEIRYYCRQKVDDPHSYFFRADPAAKEDSIQQCIENHGVYTPVPYFSK